MKTSSGFAWLVSSISLASAAPPEDERVLPRQTSLEFDGERVPPGRSALELGEPDWTVDGGQADAQLGAALASAGDVNGDGYSDAIVGAPRYTNGQIGEGRAHVPAVINLEVPAHRGEFHVKTAHIDGVPRIAVKIASGFYDNPSKGLPSGSGLMAVFDAATGLPVALLLDNGFLTDIRTGAAGAIAAEYLAPATIGG